LRARVAVFVAGDFLAPVVRVFFGLTRAALAIVPVPETTVNEDDLAQPREGQIGLARQILAV
jgi:hypothetical protein